MLPPTFVCVTHQGRFPPWTMEDGLFSWSDLMVQLPWYDFFLKTQFTKFLGPSLGVNQMWTKRNGHAPKSECVGFFSYMPKNSNFGKEKNQVGPRSCLLLSSYLLLSKEKSKILLYQHFSAMGHWFFSTSAHILPLPPQNPVDNVGLIVCLLGASNSMVILIIIGVNRSDIGTNSIANRIFYKALERLHGSWCKQPLMKTMLSIPTPSSYMSSWL